MAKTFTAPSLRLKMNQCLSSYISYQRILRDVCNPSNSMDDQDEGDLRALTKLVVMSKKTQSKNTTLQLNATVPNSGQQCSTLSLGTVPRFVKALYWPFPWSSLDLSVLVSWSRRTVRPMDPYDVLYQFDMRLKCVGLAPYVHSLTSLTYHEFALNLHLSYS